MERKPVRNDAFEQWLRAKMPEIADEVLAIPTGDLPVEP
jgi:hypothetical protein